MDVSLYGLVHELLEAERAREVADAATDVASYRRFELIAPLREGGLPAASQFRPVQCVDLSAAGLLAATNLRRRRNWSSPWALKTPFG